MKGAFCITPLQSASNDINRNTPTTVTVGKEEGKDGIRKDRVTVKRRLS
jgi:hypothetical protein